jgi:hypothetical protein
MGTLLLLAFERRSLLDQAISSYEKTMYQILDMIIISDQARLYGEGKIKLMFAPGSFRK